MGLSDPKAAQQLADELKKRQIRLRFGNTNPLALLLVFVVLLVVFVVVAFFHK